MGGGYYFQEGLVLAIYLAQDHTAIYFGGHRYAIRYLPDRSRFLPPAILQTNNS